MAAEQGAALSDNTAKHCAQEDDVPPHEPLLFMEVSPRTFAVVWCGMLILHGFCGILLALQARLYLFMTTPYMMYYTNLIQQGIAPVYPIASGVFGFLAFMHFEIVVRLCFQSIQARKLVFFHSNDASKSSSNSSSWFARLKTTLCSRRGLLGVESPLFDAYFYLRELIELISQIYQAYRASLLVGKPWINHLSVGVIVINCFSTPFIEWYYQDHPALRRVYLLTLDAVLDFIVAIVVPLSIFVPYYQAFETESMGFAPSLVYDQTWFVNAVLENQEIFVISSLDLVFKIIPHVSISSCLKKTRELVLKDSSVTRRSIVPLNQRTKVYTEVLPPSKRAAILRHKLAEKQSPKPKRSWSWCSVLLRILLVLVGTGVLAIHSLTVLQSQSLHDDRGCFQVMHPWFSTQYSCAVYELDCRRLQLTGLAEEVTEALEKLNPSTIAGLAFAHCPELSIPPILTKYYHLLTFDVFNSTIAAWPSNAALTATNHPLIASISMVRVTFHDGQLPHGLQHVDFPSSLVDIDFSHTNLQDLPDDLHNKWPAALGSVFIEDSALESFPETLQSMEIAKLSLVGNRVAQLPSTLFIRQSYFVLALEDNPISVLPAKASAETSIRYFHVESTGIHEFPDWVLDKLNDQIVQLYAFNTTFCRSQPDAAIRYDAFSALTCIKHNGSTIGTQSNGRLLPIHIYDARHHHNQSIV